MVGYIPTAYSTDRCFVNCGYKIRIIHIVVSILPTPSRVPEPSKLEFLENVKLSSSDNCSGATFVEVYFTSVFIFLGEKTNLSYYQLITNKYKVIKFLDI